MRPFKRIINPKRIDKKYIAKELENGKEVIIQFSEGKPSRRTLEKLNNLAEKYDKNFGVRFYGYTFNCKLLERIPKVKNLSVDCLQKASHIESLRQLKHLEVFSLGIYELKETEILSYENLWNISKLFITETRTKAFNLEYLVNYQNLKFLIISDHTKNIDAVGEISELETLYLNSIKKQSVEFINHLSKLKTLKFTLGGRSNIHEIEENGIENLGITWVRGFKDLSNISNFKKLKTLHIEDNIKLDELNFSNELDTLIDLKITNCKSLNKLSGLSKLNSLKDLTIYQTNLNFDKIINQGLPPSLETLVFYTTKSKIDKEIKKQIIEMGYRTR